MLEVEGNMLMSNVQQPSLCKPLDYSDTQEGKYIQRLTNRGILSPRSPVYLKKFLANVHNALLSCSFKSTFKQPLLENIQDQGLVLSRGFNYREFTATIYGTSYQFRIALVAPQKL